MIKLTKYSKGGGCGCKISPSVLSEILKSDAPSLTYPQLVVGNDTRDDAAVIDMGSGNLLISTTDFFMPIVDDPFDFGRIAAANALSDIYAMGGKPLLAIAILGWPVSQIPTHEAAKMMDGARHICHLAGIPLAGGHSVDTMEPLFGLSVNGSVAHEHLKKNSTAKPGDWLFMTKPLGVGMISTAAKRDQATPEDIAESIASMTQLNQVGEALGKIKGVHAMTDITGFGLLGHLIELCEGSHTSADIFFDKIPYIQGIEKYIAQHIHPDMTMKNFNSYGEKCSEMDEKKRMLLCDPQTSGGLLISVGEDAVNEFLDVISAYHLNSIASNPVGKITSQREKVISVF